MDPANHRAYGSTLGMAGPVYTYRQPSMRLDNLLREYAGTHYVYELVTPQELTDAQGDTVWSAHYHGWGTAKEAINDAAGAAGIRNPIRFQGQYLDPETGLHYNRHRYYDPQINLGSPAQRQIQFIQRATGRGRSRCKTQFMTATET